MDAYLAGYTLKIFSTKNKQQRATIWERDESAHLHKTLIFSKNLDKNLMEKYFQIKIWDNFRDLDEFAHLHTLRLSLFLNKIFKKEYLLLKNKDKWGQLNCPHLSAKF